MAQMDADPKRIISCGGFQILYLKLKRETKFLINNFRKYFNVSRTSNFEKILFNNLPPFFLKEDFLKNLIRNRNKLVWETVKILLIDVYFFRFLYFSNSIFSFIIFLLQKLILTSNYRITTTKGKGTTCHE